MKRSIFTLFGILFLMLSSCTSDNRCGEIINKINDEGRYLFVIRFSNGSGTNNDEFSGALESDVTVDAETFAVLKREKTTAWSDSMLGHLSRLGGLSFTYILTTHRQFVINGTICFIITGIVTRNSHCNLHSVYMGLARVIDQF